MKFCLGSIHPTADKFENIPLSLRLGLSSTLIRGKNGAFRKRRLYDSHLIFLPCVSLKLKSKMNGGCCVFKPLQVPKAGVIHQLCGEQ